MIKYIFTRLILMVVALFMIMTVVFFITNYAMFYYWVRPKVPTNQILSLTWERYLEYLKGIYTEWYWGTTRYNRAPIPVWDLVIERVPVTLVVNLIAFFFYSIIGFTLGFISALKKNGLIDRMISIIIFIFNSIPSFTMLLIMLIIFGIRLQILPTWYRPFELGMKEWSMGLIMPLFALCMAPIAHLTVLVRAEFIDTMRSDYITLAKAKGLTHKQAIVRHGIRNSMAPIAPSFVTTFVLVLANSIIIEEISKIPGVGSLFISAIIRRLEFGASFSFDINVVILIILCISLISLIITLIMDLMYRLLDPRVRVGAKT